MITSTTLIHLSIRLFLAHSGVACFEPQEKNERLNLMHSKSIKLWRYTAQKKSFNS
jgi:hypothetical protein